MRKIFCFSLFAGFLLASGNGVYASVIEVPVMAACAGQSYTAGSVHPLSQDETGDLCTNATGGGGGGGNVTIISPIGNATADANQVSVTTNASGELGTLLTQPPNVLGETSDQTPVTAGNNIEMEGTLNGKLVVLPYALPGQLQSLAPAGKTDTSAITIFAASGSASTSEYMTSIQMGRSDTGTTAITATVTDGTLSFVYVVPNSGGGGGNNVSFPVPIKFAANHAVTCTASGGVTTFYCYGQGYNAP